MRSRDPAALSFTIFMSAGLHATSPHAATSAPGTTTAGMPLQLADSTSLPEYQGDSNHCAADVAGNRLFLAREATHREYIVTFNTDRVEAIAA